MQINSITQDLNELTTRYQALNTTPTGPVPAPTTPTGSINDVKLFPTANNDSAGGSRWQEISFTHQMNSNYSSQNTESSASATNVHVNLWFASGGYSSSSSQASSFSQTASVSSTIQIGFRATLVTVDRSGWFQPQFFKQSGSYYHINQGISWSKWDPNDTMSSLTDPSRTNWDTINQYLLPAFPVGYVICKVLSFFLLIVCY